MKPLNFLQIPDGLKKELKKNHISTNIDFHRLSIKHWNIIQSIFEKFIPVDPDTDNSNTIFNSEIDLSITKFLTRNWYWYDFKISIPWIWPIQACFLEIYSWSQAIMLKSLWRIDFAGWFFHLKKFLPTEIIDLYKILVAMEEHKLTKTTRVDIAVDVEIEVPRMFFYIKKPSKVTKKDLKCYNFQLDEEYWTIIENEENWYSKWNFQSYSYLPKKWKWNWIRVYNKFLDIIAKWKQSWYNFEDEKILKLTRFEFVYTSDCCEVNNIQRLIEISHSALFWETLPLGLKYKTKSDFTLDNAYDYIDKYCIKRCKNTNEVIWDLYEKKIIGDGKFITKNEIERVKRMYFLVTGKNK